MLIDLRSDTITKPTPGMLEAMFKAEVGDDVFGEDPTVRSLERRTADIFGMDAGLFCPSGTMANQIAIRVLTNPQDELICDAKSHIQNYEGGGIAYNSFVTAQTVYGEKGKLNADLIIRHIKPDNIHFPVTSLVAVENTVNKGGGSIYTLEEIAEVYSVCRQYGLKLHLDGARLFNALVETGEDPSRYGKYFDTITISLSKGLGAPVGSVLIMKEPYIKKAKRVRKVLGGGMRQAGYLAAAGIYALDHHVDRLAEDHQRARKLSDVLNELPWVSAVTPPVTNILICSLPDHLDPTQVLNTLKASGILGVSFGGQDIRFVTHLDFTDAHMEAFSRQIKALNIH
jgi:threonine aldolase